MINETGFGKLNKDLNLSLQQLLRQEDWQNFISSHLKEKMPDICEKACGMSYPVEYHHQWKRYKGFTTKDNIIKTADISFGNICNLTCTMCGPTWSNEWLKFVNQKDRFAWNFNFSQCIELANILKNCESIVIKGGEPFLNKNFVIFLKQLNEIYTDSKLNFNVLTNGTVCNQDALEIINNFPYPNINISIESTENDLYKWVRGGIYSLDTIFSNISYIKKNYKNILLRANYIVGSVNIDNFLQDMNILREIQIDELNLMLIKYPLEQSISIVKQKYIKKFINDLLTDSKLYPSFYKLMTNMNTLQDTIEHLKSIPTQKIDKNYLIERLNFYNHIRYKQTNNINLDLLKIKPNFCNFINLE
jgi:MoaA/NifB/PqqE/SkfB family radical SAM enzyme